MDIDILHLIEGAKQARGLAVIIDVFRAFTTACYAVRNGAVGIIPVGDADLAYQLKKENPDYILMGERQGKKLPGFDYGNSPTEIETVEFSGKRIFRAERMDTFLSNLLARVCRYPSSCAAVETNARPVAAVAKDSHHASLGIGELTDLSKLRAVAFA